MGNISCKYTQKSLYLRQKRDSLIPKHLTLCHTDTALSSPSFPHFSALVYSSFPADIGSPSPRGIKWPHIGCLSDQYRIIPHTTIETVAASPTLYLEC